ncbi:MAG TPA: hypothetical protein VGM86_16410 [Thermoanaerobaculia bacterium]|jgi:hypothetical protein
MDTLGIAKITSIVATAVFAALGITKEFKDKQSGRVTKWGKIAIGGICISLLISLYAYHKDAEKDALNLKRAQIEAQEAKRRYNETKDSLEAARKVLNETFSRADRQVDLQNNTLRETSKLKGEFRQTFLELEKKQRDMLKAQKAALNAEDQIRHWQLREAFPLTPLTISFTKAYSLDDPCFSRYRARLEKTSPKLYLDRPLSVRKFIQSEVKLAGEELPKPDDDACHSSLIWEKTRFKFKGDGSNIPLEFECSQGDASYSVNIGANAILKTVVCRDLLPLSRDTLTISAVDLVGQTLTWASFSRVPFQYFDTGYIWMGENRWKMAKISLAFPYNRSRLRSIGIPDGANSVFLSARTLGLERIFP